LRHPTPADPHAPISARRRAVLLATSLLAIPARALAADLRPTPANAEGPFYPPNKPADSDADLTQVAGHANRAKGTTLHVAGRVLDIKGAPVPNAVIEVWQCNAFGRYIHPSDSESSGPLDPDFQGYARLVAGNDGAFRIKTIKPPPYGARTPHIHYIVASSRTRLTTQMFFEGEAMNDRDGLYRYLSRDDRRASTARFVAASEPDAVAVAWDIVLSA
jgi:protocatechuate 3,4-dioxygenase, beta subunit